MSVLKCTDTLRQCLEPCGCLPSGFSRLKYFYGKHLSVTDFKDEQRYHVGKNLFHNTRLHGSGVLCGLDVYIDPDFPQELRLKSGSALDQCGREIIVPVDQCIDAASWYRAQYEYQLEQDAETDWPSALINPNGAIVLCVMLRYTECPTSPESAPRDPCGCGDSSCEFGRISEGFQLELMPQAEANALIEASLFPSESQITDVLNSTFEGLNLLRRLAKPITDSCPAGIEEAWIKLGCVEVMPDQDTPGEMTTVPESSDYVPPVLLSTELIQYLLSNIYADLDTDIGGPSIVDVRWRKNSDTVYQIILILDKEIDENSIDTDDSFHLRKMTNVGWATPPVKAVTTEYHLTDPVSAPDAVLSPALYVTIDDSAGGNDFLDAGDKYHLFKGATPGPIVDSELRSLRPRDFIWRFRLIQNTSGDLEMQTPPFGS